MSKVNLDKITAKIEEQLKRWDVPGLSLAVVQDGETVFAGGVGLRDNESLPFTGDTLVQIGSCSKAFTATLIARLATDGLLDMDKPVAEYIPGFKLSDDYATLHLTIRDFLSHRSGLPRHEYAWYGSGYSRNELVYNLRFLQMNQPVRYKYQYSNFNYLIAGALVEAVTGMKFEDAMTEKLIKPLGLKHTFVYLDQVESEEDHALPFDHSEEYTMTGIRRVDYYESPAEFRSENAKERVGDPTGPAGCIVSNAKDMAVWINFNLAGGKTADGVQLVRPDLMQLIYTSHITTGDDPAMLPERSMNSYALGWSIINYRGHKLVEHGGSLPGFIASTSFMPDLNLGVFVCANMNVCLITEAIFCEIIDDVLGAPDGNWYDRMYAYNDAMFRQVVDYFKSFGGEPLPDTKPAHPLADYAGEYRAPGYNRFIITEKEGQLTADFNTWKPALRHHHYESFATCGSIGELPAGLILTFGTDGTGKVSTLTVTLGSEANLNPIVFVKVKEDAS
ncbi:MAG: serine hydrolase [Eubacterium sp.]|nr:serine hydrolase [Eubacterium sp.]